MGWPIITILSIVFVLWTFRRLARQVRRPQRAKATTPLIGIVMALTMLTVNVLILHRAAANLLAIGLLMVGVGFGLAWGQATRLSQDGDTLVAERSALHLVFWAISFTVTQILAAVATMPWVAGGLLTMFFSAGATLGTSANLLIRLSGAVAAPKKVPA